jgi:hypothetical protein
VIAFRWTVGALAALLAVGTVLSFVIALIWANDIWYRRARHFLHWLWVDALLWFNVEVWGRVAWTLFHWTS